MADKESSICMEFIWRSEDILSLLTDGTIPGSWDPPNPITYKFLNCLFETSCNVDGRQDNLIRKAFCLYGDDSEILLPSSFKTQCC